MVTRIRPGVFFPCANRYCPSQWFVLHDLNHAQCPFCGSKPKGKIPIMKLRKESRPGQWIGDGKLVIYHNLSLFKWHIFDNIFPGEEVDRTPQAYCVFHEGNWLLINQNLTSLMSSQGNLVPPGSAIKLAHGI
ncbi:serine/threonine protein kinase, partial [Arthrospira platensis SPKY1]|nr:serine/threonine protein kinase [Arthrospira platensis SPKY1]